jgi:ubiquinone biosynthesis protein COQ4
LTITEADPILFIVRSDNKKELAMVTAADAPATVHIPPLPARLRTIARCLATLARDPGRLDVVLLMTQTVNLPALGAAVAWLEQDDGGRRLLSERPRIDRSTVDFEALERLPDGTLGREYVRFLRDNGITPEPFERAPVVGDDRAEYIMLRLRQTHDLWHVLTGYAPDVRGEILLQSFTYAQTRAPSALLIAAFGWFRFGYLRPSFLRDLVRAYERGESAGVLPTFRWEDEWETPVAELRARLTCPSA